MKRQTKEACLLVGLAVALAIAFAGCSGSIAPTLPSPGGGGNTAVASLFSVAMSVYGGPAEEVLPETLNASNFSVQLQCGENPPVSAPVVGVDRATTTGLDLVFIIDTTGSMGGEIEGVKNSVLALADTFTGVSVRWGGVEYGDLVRTEIGLTPTVADFKTWVDTLGASGGNDAPENPLDAIMHAWNTFSWRPGVQRMFVLITDVGAHQRGDDTSGGDSGAEYLFTGAEVIAALSGNAIVHVVGPLNPSEWAGWDTKALADATGGNFIQLAGGTVDLSTLGIAESVRSTYRVTYRVPAGETGPCDVIVTVNFDGKTGTRTFQDVMFGTPPPAPPV